MNQENVNATRLAAEQPAPRARKRIDQKKLGIAAVASVFFFGFLWLIAGGDSDDSSRSGVRVDALKRDGGDRYGLLIARSPETDEPKSEPEAERISVATVPAPAAAPIQVETKSLDAALATIDKLNDRIDKLQDELTDAKVVLARKDSNLTTANQNLKRLQEQYDQREKRFAGELSKATADAEARALANVGVMHAQGLSEEKKQRLKELREKQREAQNQSNGIVFDESPYGRKN
ncbi:hypothetical protein [uncultured Ruegeria sp.]|uniref:hypothetical protein n=1 Tax=uncultured Ruegeria sp. TaxID=259304 RepID=UPI00260D5065|nr:hypothetical protein [uncultured Ruegeria sp.]